MRKPLVAALLCLPLLATAAPAAAQAAEPRPAATQAAASVPSAAQAAALQARLTNVQWDLSSNNPGQIRDAYTAFMRSFRDATGVVIRTSDGRTVWETRNTDDIVAVNITLPNSGRLTLYVTVRDLYVRGFSTGNDGNVIQFRDTGYNLGRQLNRNGMNLPYGGHYSGTRDGVVGLNAGEIRDRRVDINSGRLQRDLAALAAFAHEGSGAANELRPRLVTAIAVTSEAARYRDIENTVRNGLDRSDGSTRLSEQQAAEENDWSRGSRYMFQANSGQNPRPVRLGNINLDDWIEGSRYLAMLLVTQKTAGK
ncbi:ribosome-inactivating family protein [Streptomyces rimosus]|uniref:ribosome-inactivating family protein n=1 Tax=Streptomyces rimosus TaxID=1927 RepID=UPI0004C91973|nr:ribosome-inactivating family protein [Streptomyces rimosus]